jgi:Xaa-Pro aminopeptidase
MDISDAARGGPSRISRLIGWLASEDAVCLVVSGQEYVNHIAGYWRYFGSPAAAVLETDGALTLVVAYDEAEDARDMLPATTVMTYGTRGFGLVPDPTPLLVDALASVPAVACASRLAVASHSGLLAQSLRESRRAPQLDARGAVASVQLVKDDEEISRIERAYRLAWLAQGSVADELRGDVSEIELFSRGQAAAQVAAGEPIAFFGDLLSGTRSAEVCAPIRVAGPVKVGEGAPVVSDLVVGLRGYWGDTAETISAGPNHEMEEIRTGLVSVLEACAAELCPGQSAAAVYEAMCERIRDQFPAGEFPHHGGHGVGLGSYEDPHIIGDDRSLLEAGMVIALEPGVYFPGRFGVRVERMYVVADDGGAEIAPDAPRNRREH